MSIPPTPHRPRFRPDLSPGLTAMDAFVIIGRGLLELLAARQEVVKGESSDTFEAFAAPEVTDPMAQLTRT